MTVHQRKLILKAIVDEINKSPKKSMVCARIKGKTGLLQSIGLSDDILAGMKLKAWISEFFAEDFYITPFEGADHLFYIGKDYPNARSYIVIGEIIKKHLTNTQKISIQDAKFLLHKNYGISISDFCNENELQEWLTHAFSYFNIQGDIITLKGDSSHASPVSASRFSPELEMFSSLVFLSDFNRQTREICERIGVSLSLIEAKLKVATAFSSMLMQQDSEFFLDKYEEKNLIAFRVSLAPNTDQKIFCVLQENHLFNEHPVQYWCFYSYFIYPDAQNSDPIFQWLIEQIESSNDKDININALKKATDKISALRQEIIPKLEQYLTVLHNGTKPDNSIGEDILAYEDCWEALTENLSLYFNESISVNLSLKDIKAKISERESVHSSYFEATTIFKEFLRELDTFLKENLCLESPTIASKDLDTLLNESNHENEIIDTALLSERLSLYNSFWDMLKTKEPTVKVSLLQELQEPLCFGNYDIYQMLSNISKIPEDAFAFMSKINDVDFCIDRYYSDLKANVSKKHSQEDISATTLLDLRLNDFSSFMTQWVDIALSILPEDDDLTSIIDNYVLPVDGQFEKINAKTPYGAATRLYQQKGNVFRLAEKYLILGSAIDQESCIPSLMRIYREAESNDEFLKVWEHLNGKNYATDVDYLHYLKILLTEENSQEIISFLQETLKKKPSFRHYPYFVELLQSKPKTPDIPSAFWVWCDKNEVSPNKLEEALANNNLNEIFTLLDTPSTLRDLGYTEKDTEIIKTKLKEGLFSGISDYARGMRVYAVQGNRNRVAEKYFFTSFSVASNKMALLRLFDIYYEASDYQSVNWLVSALDVPIEHAIDYRLKYAYSLVYCDDINALIAFAEKSPDILHDTKICDYITKAEPSDNCKYNWSVVTSQKPEIKKPCEFELSVIEGNKEEIRKHLESSEKMEGWGYSQETQNRIRESLQNDDLSGNDLASTCSRIWAFQENLHGFYEDYLYTFIDSNRQLFLKKLCAALYQTQRYEELVVFFAANTNYKTDEQTTLYYLWSLLLTGRNDDLMNVSACNIKAIAKSPDLQLRLEEVFEAAGRTQDFEDLLKKMRLISHNAFEACLINYDDDALHAFVSDRERLKNLGYSDEQINKFSSCYSKPFDKGDDAFAVACRIRAFLGDSRALQFFCDIEQTDPRAAKCLFDIYLKNKRYDDVCFLYRRNPENVWNDHFFKQYANALTKTKDPENCKVLVSMIDNWSPEYQGAVDVSWHYLRALIGSSQSLSRIELHEENLLKKNDAIVIELLTSCFDLAWTKSDKIKENIILFAEKLLSVYEDSINFEKRMIIAGINGNLLKSEESEKWLNFIKANGLTKLLFVLNSVYGFGLSSEDEKTDFLNTVLKSIQVLDPETTPIDFMREYFFAIDNCRPAEETDYELYNEYISRLFIFILDKCHTTSEEDRLSLCNFLSSIDLKHFATAQLIQIMDMLSPQCKTDEPSGKNDPLSVFGLNLLSVAINQLKDSDNTEDTSAFKHSAENLSAHLSVRIEALLKAYPHLLKDENWHKFFVFFDSPLFPKEELENISNSILSGIVNNEISSENLRLLTTLPEKILKTLAPEKLKDIIINYIKNVLETPCNEEEAETFSSALSYSSLKNNETREILDALSDKDLLTDSKIFNTIRMHCVSIGSEMEYELYKLLLQDNFDYTETLDTSNLLTSILECARSLPIEKFSTSEDLELIYQTVCKQNSIGNLSFLYELYKNAGFNEQSEIISILLKLSDPLTALEGVSEVDKMFTDRNLEWIELYSKWWTPLLSLSENEAQTQKRLPYLDENAELDDEVKVSLVKLLLSDIYEPSCLKACTNKSLDFSPATTSKLFYLLAVSGASYFKTVSTIKELFANKEFDLAMSLFKNILNARTNNSSVVGQLLGDIYTSENVKACDELKNIAPEIYEWIGKMNTIDPQGEWKNLSRAVEISKLTKTEMKFFEILGETIFLNHPGHCSVVVSELLKQGRYDDAKKWHDKAYAENPAHQYLRLQHNIIRNCLETSELSYGDKLLLHSIPATGNNRSLEDYGDLVFRACEDGKPSDCLNVLTQLYPYESNDRALLVPLMDFFVTQDLHDNQFVDFYTYAKTLLTIDAGSPNQKDSALIFVAADACLPNKLGQKDSWQTVVRNALGNNDETQVLMNDLQRFRANCDTFLSESGNPAYLLRLTMGKCEIDNTFVSLLSKREDFEKLLISIHPISYVAAFICAKLENRLDEKTFSKQINYLDNPTFTSVIEFCDKINEPDDITRALSYFAKPLGIPGVSNLVFRNIIDTETEENLESILMLFFSVLSYSYPKYKANAFGFKEYVENFQPSTKNIVMSVLMQLNYISTGKPPLPAECAKNRDYMLMITAAEYYIRHPKDDTNKKQTETLLKLNKDYELLGKIMEGHLSAKELLKIPLSTLINLTILLCQSEKAYIDFPVILSFCPAKWKICLRCLQELMQGCPRNILYVMEKDSFWETHDGCAAFIAKIAYKFLYDTNKSSPLSDENKKYNRADNWGVFKENEIKRVKTGILNSISSVFIWKIQRNPQNISDFKNDIDAYLAEMENDDLRKKQLKTSDKNATEPATADPLENVLTKDSKNDYDGLHDFHNLTYINKAIVAWKEQKDLSDADKATFSPISEDIAELCEKLYGRIDEFNDAGVRLNCLNLGLKLFEQHCEGEYNAIVTEEAFAILEEVTNCISDNIKSQLPYSHIGVAVYNTLRSANDWEGLLAYCKPWLLFLSEQINDPNKRQSYSSHIKFIQETGVELSKPMTLQERSQCIESRIRACRAKQSTLDRELKQILINFLNEELLILSNQAQITLEIYEKEYSLEEDSVTGMVRNLGQMQVNDVNLELRIDDVCISRCALSKLDHESAIPFSLPVSFEEEDDDTEIQVYIQYVTTEGRTENFTRKSKIQIRSEFEDDYEFAFFTTGEPAENKNYVERTKLQRKLNTWFSPKKSPNELPNMVVYGMRRMGKSSVLKWLKKHIENNFAEQVLVPFINLEDVPKNMASLTQRVQHCLVERTLAKIIHDAPELKSVAWDEFCQKWEQPMTATDNFDWIPQFFSELKEGFLQDKQLVLIIDEVEGLYMNNKKSVAGNTAFTDAEDDSLGLSDADVSDVAFDLTGQTNFWDTLSVITQDNSYGVTLILCGADPFTNTVMAGDNLTQFFQRTEKLSIGRMTSAEIKEALQKIEEQSDIRYHRDTIDYLWTLTAGLPWHSKRIINVAIQNILIEEDRTMLYPYDILCGANKIFNSDLDVSDNSMGMGAPSSDEKIFLSLLAEETISASTWVSKSILWERFKERAGDEDTTTRFAKVLKMLIDGRQMILKQENDSDEEYRFGSELNRLFARKQKIIPQFT